MFLRLLFFFIQSALLFIVAAITGFFLVVLVDRLYDYAFPPDYYQNLPPYEYTLDPTDPLLIDILNLSEEEQQQEPLYILDALLKMVERDYPGQDADYVRTTIDKYVETLRPIVERARSGRYVADVMRRFIFRKEKFATQELDELPYEYPDIVSFFKMKKGVCMHLCLLYVAIAERLGLPMKMAISDQDQHVIILYDDGVEEFYIDPTMNAMNFEDIDKYIEMREFLSPFEVIDSKGILSSFLKEFAERKFVEGMEKEAEDILFIAIQLDPKNSYPFFELSKIYLNSGRTIEGLNLTTQAIEQARPNTAIHKIKGLALVNQSEYEQAIPFLKTGVTRQQDKFDALLGLGICHLKLNRLSETETYFEQALKLDAQSENLVKCIFHYAESLRQQKKYDKAIEQYNKVLEKKSGHIEALIYLGESYRELGESEKALEAFERAYKIDPGYLAVIHGLALTNWELKQYESAIPHFVKASIKKPEDHSLLHLLDDCYYQLDKQEELNETVVKLGHLGFIYRVDLSEEQGGVIIQEASEMVIFPYVYEGNPYSHN